MVSLREGIEKAQFQTPPATKIREVAEKLGLQPPISLLRVARLLKPKTLDWDTGSISSGEMVTANGHVLLTSTGFWKFSGEVHDSGDGATFGFVMLPKFVDASAKVLIFAETDELSDDETISFSKEGRDLWITRNWDAIRSSGFTWRLNASTVMSLSEALSVAILPLLAMGAATWAGVKCIDEEDWTTNTNQDGSTSATCNIE